VEIHIPPLRERIEDIPLLAGYYLDIYKNKYKKPELRISPAGMKRLENYTWPGNVRELQHMIERSVILSEGNALDAADFFFGASNSKEDEDVQLDNYNLDDVEKTIIQKVISKNEGNITKAAKELGLTRTSLYRRMEKYGL